LLAVVGHKLGGPPITAHWDNVCGQQFEIADMVVTKGVDAVVGGSSFSGNNATLAIQSRNLPGLTEQRAAILSQARFCCKLATYNYNP
jgi:hypothetical protein